MKSDRDTKFRSFLFCGVIAPFILLAAVTVAGRLTPNYNPVTDSVSKIGIPGRPYAWLLHSGYYVYALMIGLAAYGCHRTLAPAPGAARLSISLGFHALGMALLAVFPDSNTSISGHLVHDVMSGTAYLPLIIGIFISRRIARHEITLKTAGILGIFIIIANIPMPFVYAVDFLSAIGGLLQRILSGISYTWLVVVFCLLYRKRLSIERRSRDTMKTGAETADEYLLAPPPPG